MQDMYKNAVGDWTGLGGTLVSGAGTYFGSVEQRKASEAQAEALKQQGLTQLEIAKVQQQTKLAELEALKSGAGTKAGSKTLYIALGVGAVVVLGVVIFAVTRKKA
jgi:hypothetical protein